MTNVSISNLPTATSILGPELVPIVQNGVTSHTTASSLGLVGESIGAKLRNLAAIGSNSNIQSFFISNPPLRAPVAWATNQTVQYGEVRSANGNWYVQGTAPSGTTAGSGGGPSAGVSNALIVDNTCTWAYLCLAPITTNSPYAPVLTQQVAATPTGLANYFNCIAMPSVFRVTGGYPTTVFTNYWEIFSFRSIGVSQTGVSAQISFVTDAAKFAVGVTNGSFPVRIRINGQYVDIGGLTFMSGGTPTWIILDFTSSGGRSIRNVTIDMGGLQTFAGVACTANDQVWAPPIEDTVLAAVISDSLFSGSAFGPFLAGGDTSYYMGRALGWDNVWDISISGTGWLASGSGAAYTYRQRVNDMWNNSPFLRPDVWLFMGSTNDIGQSTAAITTEVTTTINAIRTLGSTAPIIIFGVWSINAVGVAGIENAISAGVIAANDAKTYFIPILADPSLPWLTGAWNNSKNTGSTNATIYAGSDGVHPTETGTNYLGVRLAKGVANNVLPNLL